MGLAVLTALALLLLALSVRRDRTAEPENRQDLAVRAAQSLPHYDLDLVLDPDAGRLDGVMTLDYVNLESVTLDTLYFYIWPNSFASRDYGVFEGEEEQAYPDGFESGSLDVESVTSEGAALAYEIGGEQDQVLAVTLPRAVPPGKRIQMTIKYAVTIPECYGRFGHGDNTWSLVNAHPILCVCDDETGQWYNEYRYYSVGDPFYSDAADYTARIEVPRGYEVAATGSQTTDRSGDTWVTRISGPAQRDFGFVASDDFKVYETTAGDITVRSWYYGSDWLGERAAQAAVGALKIFSERYGDYCWDEFDVVMCDFYIGGMEYPGMVLIDESVYTLTSAMLMEMIVAHETAHQWFYAAVGSNQIAEPWLDEALAEFSTALYFEDRYPSNGEKYRDLYVYGNYKLMESIVTVADGAAVDSPVTDFINSYDYSLVIYGWGARMLDDLRTEIGEKAFFEGLSNYYREHAFGLAVGGDLIQAFSRTAGRDLTGWFAQYFK
jgi:aminopeptidase N